MSLLRPAAYDNGAVRMPLQGDLLCNNEAIVSNATVGNLQITGALMSSGILSRSGPVAGYADIFPPASDLINGLLNNYFQASGAISGIGIPPNTAFRFKLINTVAFTNTPTIGAGGTLGANTAIAASSVKDYLVTITNGTPQVVAAGNTTNASAIVTGIATGPSANSLANITVGMLVTGTGIPAATTVASIQYGIGVTLSANATATNSQVALTFSPTYRVDSLGQMLL